MQTEQIAVSPRAADIYRKASPKEQRRAEIALMMSLMSREEAVEELKRIMDEMGRQAQENGLTPEILEELLNDDE